MTRRDRIVSQLALACIAALLLAGCAAPQPEKQKIKVETLDDLPQHTYPFTGNVVELIRSDEQIADLAVKVRADIEDTLEKYEIDDPTTLQGMYGKLLTIDLIENRYNSAAARIEQVRDLEDKEAARLTTGLVTLAWIDAIREVGPDAAEVSYKKAFRRILRERAGRLPYAVVQDEIQESKGRMEIMSETLLVGMVQAQMQPVVDKNGELNADMAAGVLGLHFMIKERLPLKDEIIAVYQELIDANQTVKPDIWAKRDVELSPDEDCTPVLMAAWDSGTDPAVFSDIVWVNTSERENGEDDDGNGYVDDVHGIAFDIHARRTTGMLCPLGDTEERIAQVMEHMKGFMDIQASVDSPEASALKKHLASLSPDEVKGFIEDLGLAGNYAHGTHVAGLMTAGNPFAELLIARLSYDHRMIPVARTQEWGVRDGQKCRDTVDYFKQRGVRVVNMSWGEAQQDAEDSLEKNGIGDNAEERREMARKVFKLQRQGLYEAIKNAPDILFVCAAGNADNDVEFDEYIPSSFDLPNLLVVGAVDQAGDPTSFTSSGRTVQVYANGFEVESYVPGGERMKMSGTSMASPNVANLAGKLIAIDPSLTPTEVIEMIKAGAETRTVGEMTYLLMNPQRSVNVLRTRISSR